MKVELGIKVKGELERVAWEGGISLHGFVVIVEVINSSIPVLISDSLAMIFSY